MGPETKHLIDPVPIRLITTMAINGSPDNMHSPPKIEILSPIPWSYLIIGEQLRRAQALTTYCATSDGPGSAATQSCIVTGERPCGGMIIGSGTWPAGRRLPGMRRSCYCRQDAAGAPGEQEQEQDYIDSLAMTTEDRHRCGYLVKTNGNTAAVVSRPLYQLLVSVRLPTHGARTVLSNRTDSAVVAVVAAGDAGHHLLIRPCYPSSGQLPIGSCNADPPGAALRRLRTRCS
jgi:hypothetical protein